MNNEKQILKVVARLRETADELEKLVTIPCHTTFWPELGQTQSTVAGEVFLRAMNQNSHKLKGRMTLSELSEAIGMEIKRGDRVAIGLATSAYGAIKGKSGSTRYYVFSEPEGNQVTDYVRAITNSMAGMRGMMRLQEIAARAGILLTPENRKLYQAAMDKIGIKAKPFRGNRYYDIDAHKGTGTRRD